MNPQDFHSSQAGRVILTSKGYYAFIPNRLPPEIEWSSSLVFSLAEAERELGSLAAVIGQFPFPRLLIQPFVRSEAVISSRIEGTRASLVDLLTYETEQLSFFEKTDDVREVFNYVRAVDYGLDRLKTLPVSLRLIRELHEKLMENVRGGKLTPGEFRRTQNWIGPVGSTVATASFVPPPVDEMNEALAALENYVHASSDLPHLIKAGLIHYQFEAIHPFLDGNGRVGRLLIILLMYQWGLLSQPLLNMSEYFDRYRQQYYDLLLDVSREGSWETWLIYFLRGVSEQSRDGVERLHMLTGIRAAYQHLVESSRNPARMSLVIDFLFTRPILSVRQLSDGLGIPFKTALDYLAKLTDAGVLREITGHARNRIFRADEILVKIQERNP